MAVGVTEASAVDMSGVEAILAAADLSSRQPEFLGLTLENPAFRTFLAWRGGDPVATALGISFGPTGWIGNVAVHPDHRRRGLGLAATEAALSWLAGNGAATVRLLATDLGRPLYQRLGFVQDGEPWQKYTVPPGLEPKGPTAVLPANLARALAVDRAATGETRDAILRPFAQRLVATAAGDGYALVLPWGGGPVVAADDAAAHALWWHVYGHTPQSRWAVPGDNEAARALAAAYGLSSAGTSVPMRYGADASFMPGASRWAAWSMAVG